MNSYKEAMTQTYYIHSYCQIKNSKLYVDGDKQLEDTTDSFNDFLKKCYLKLSIDYPKFFKMDELCKLAFIGTEYLIQNTSFKEKNTGETSIILSNASSTIATDEKHQQSIQQNENFFPSPAIFVYTLPNISIGEIGIRHKIQGENSFFVTKKYDTNFMIPFINSLLKEGRAKQVITGWVEYNNNCYDCFLYFVGTEKHGINLIHTAETINNLYNSII